MKPRLVEKLHDWIEIRRNLDAQGASIGFVPTMGALHEGHASLLARARAENDVRVLSIYVNPTQFDNKDDLSKYPKTLEGDLEIASKHGVDYVLLPTFEQIYPDGYRYKISENELSKRLCGAHRPGHFDGVLTVVMKLLNLVRPSKAYFGEKDQQQLQLVKGMSEAFFLNVDIVPCPTVRESDGLAMSSRNVRLTPSERERAPQFAAALREAPSAEEARTRLAQQGFEVDYVEDVEGLRYGAVKLGKVRLIDNVKR